MKLKSALKEFLFMGKLRRVTLVAFDLICFAIVDLGYYLLAGQASYSTPVNNGGIYLYNSICLAVCIFAMRFAFKSYNNVWRYTNTGAYVVIMLADILGGGLSLVVTRFVVNKLMYGFYIGIWHSVTVTALSILAALLSRFVYRLLYKYSNKQDERMLVDKARSPVAIIGAGQLGAYLANELQNSYSSHYQPRCFIDISSSKIGNRVAGLPVYAADEAAQVIDKYGITDVIIAIAKINADKTKAIWDRYDGLGCRVKVYDTPFHAAEEQNGEQKRIIRDFAIEDLLFRNPLDINSQTELSYYKNKKVLVTGGGGSIGSEICRQIAKCSPKQIIIFDIYENNAYEIQQELIRKYGEELNLSVEIGSVRDKERLECIFENYRPDIVFHAAAHKHVPLMENSAVEAVKNNVMGTYRTADMAEKHGVEKSILISTDKAVNPTNIMGASKRICEMVVQCRTDSKTSFAAVRFGNVLGSNGSVIPLFKRQIAAGGPVTITDKRIIRYFMTIPEASQLVMLAGAKAQRGELFVLDMGQPVRIYDLAVNMIKLMGYRPDVDIEIKEIGLRPGEKLYEELLMKGESLIATEDKMIFIEKDTPYSRQEVDNKLEILMQAVDASRHILGSEHIKAAIKQTVPTFVEPSEMNSEENLKNAGKDRELVNA